MDGTTMRSVAEYIVEIKRGDRKGDGTSKCSPKYPETEFDTNGIQRDWGGDERCDQNISGKSGNNIRG